MLKSDSILENSSFLAGKLLVGRNSARSLAAQCGKAWAIDVKTKTVLTTLAALCPLSQDLIVD